MKRIILFLFAAALALTTLAQTNITCSNKLAESVMLGNYNPTMYAIGNGMSDHKDIICSLHEHIRNDSLKAYLLKLSTFHNRHTYSDTLSTTTGIGAARRWTEQVMHLYGKRNNNRLLTGYISFDYANGSCGSGLGFKNTIGVLPGTDTSDKSIILVEAHLDSRCENACDINCLAAGIEDNGSGVALVLELARIMTQHNYQNTIVFMFTVGEEQGLYGAKAMAKYCADRGIKIKAVLNNDVVGGIYCGQTSSQPGCEGEGTVDSTQVRIFSNGGLPLPHRGLARTIKMYYDEHLKSVASVPMAVSVMDAEDRIGRGGDHIPFVEKGYPSVRFTAANEHGHAHPDSTYEDRQHSSRDILGKDTNGDMIIDEFFVDFNYLKRNTVINGMAITLLAKGPSSPIFDVKDEPTGLRVVINGNTATQYRIGVRGLTNNQNFEAFYRTNQTDFVIPGLETNKAYRISVAGINELGIMSPFGGEILKINDVNTAPATPDVLNLGVDCKLLSVVNTVLKSNEFLMTCQPNPNNGLFTISIKTSTEMDYASATIKIIDFFGREIQSFPFSFSRGMGKVGFDLNLASGNYVAILVMNGSEVESQKIVVQ